jgi:phage terminase small subunit
MEKKQTKANQTKSKTLTARENKFVEAMADPNTKSLTEAAIKAGYSLKSARYIGYENSTKPYIKKAIAERKKRVIEHTRVTPEEVLGSAVFNMRSSIDDLLDEGGSFDIEKARQTGAIDIVKKLKETTRTIIDQDGNSQTVKTVEVEIESPAAARRQVADYINVQNHQFQKKEFTEEDMARELYHRLVDQRHWSKEQAIEGISKRYPNLDVKALLQDA